MPKEKLKKNHGQVFLEFTFCFLVLLLLLYGCVMAFRWAGLSFADIRTSHDSALRDQSVDEGWTIADNGPLKQLNPNFYKPRNMNLVFNNW